MTRGPAQPARDLVRQRRDRARLGSGLVMEALLATFAPAADIPPDFERCIAPILKNRCLECHNATGRSGGLDLNATGRSGGLDHSSRVGFSRGGESGPAIVPV